MIGCASRWISRRSSTLFQTYRYQGNVCIQYFVCIKCGEQKRLRQRAKMNVHMLLLVIGGRQDVLSHSKNSSMYVYM